MIVLDTNVLSELMRPEPDAGVFAWIDAQPRETLYTTTIVQAEILYGVACLAPGRQRDALSAAAEALFTEDLRGRVLPFTAEAAQHYGAIAAARRSQGRPIAGFDALIAACARAAKAAVATRDLGGFEYCGLELINPWDISAT